MTEMFFRGLPVVDEEAPPPTSAPKRAGMMYRGLAVPDAALAGPAPALPDFLPARARVVLAPAPDPEASRAQSSPETAAPVRPGAWRTPRLLLEACREVLPRLRPNSGEPVPLVVQAVALLALVLALAGLATGRGGGWAGWLLAADAGLVLTVLAVHFARALGAVRERHQADTARRPPEEFRALRLCRLGQGQPLLQALGGTGGDAGRAEPDYYEVEQTVSTRLRRGDLVLVEAGQPVPCDGEVVAGAALIDEAAVTGESAPALREAGGLEPGVRAATRLLSGRIVVSVSGGPDRRSAAG